MSTSKLLGLVISTCLLASSQSVAAKMEFPNWNSLKLDDYLKSKEEALEIKALDPKKQGKSSFFVLTKPGEDSRKTLIMQLFDFDGDGKIDLAKHFKSGKLVRSEWNLDRDENAEVVKFHNPEDESVTRKMETDGQQNILSYYFKGQLRRKEFDRNKDGKIDMWYYYQGGKLVKATAGKDFDPNKLEDITKKITVQ